MSVCLPLYTVDAFSDVPFAGNQAAVCLDNVGLSADIMQNIAAEMNIAETAFIRLKGSNSSFNSASSFGLRWFTPQTEVPLCGHATLASAAVLYKCIGNTSAELVFSTEQRGTLTAKKNGDLISLDFPTSMPEPESDADLEELIQMVVGDLPVQELHYCSVTSKLLVRLADSITRTQLEAMPFPDVSKMVSIHKGKVKGVMVTVSSDGAPYDFVSRYFAPWVGINEDTVTGSAHTVLGPYWSKVLGKRFLKARQCSPRGGDLELTLKPDGRIDISGAATVVIKGDITLKI